MILLVLVTVQLSGQSYALRGRLLDDQALPLASGTVVLLNPADSTMEFFGITDSRGRFEIRSIKAGNYLLQASFMGFRPFYNSINLPRARGADVGDIVMQTLPVTLDGAEVHAEAVPLQIHGDTVIYNAAAFKTSPDAMTEDLLKKLPGIEVDRAGNIKALGEDVNTLYVDGKEFFSSDPTVATRNIPADAIQKVQVYDKNSDESEFTGIDDGTRHKTVNLELKEDKKKGLFGDLLGGYGTDNRYKASAKAYRFTDKFQIAGLGMINNVNEYGFSFSDYLDFNGGISAMSGGGGSAKITLGGENSFPINFGEPVDGVATSGAGGLNFSYSTDKHNRSYISYLVNGSDKTLEQSIHTEQYTDAGSFTSNDLVDQWTLNNSHQFNFGLRRRQDSTHHIIFSGNVGLMNNKMDRLTHTVNISGEEVVSGLLNDRGNVSERINGQLSAAYYRMIGKNRSVLKASGTASYSNGLDNILVDNDMLYANGDELEPFRQFQNNQTDLATVTLMASYTQEIGKGLFIEPEINLGGTLESLDRIHGLLGSGNENADTLNHVFDKNYRWLRPGVNLRWNTRKSNLSMGLIAEIGDMETELNNEAYPASQMLYFTPTLSWDYSPKTGRNINLSYASSLNTPTVRQLFPVANTLNPANIYYGNPYLEPEYSHTLMSHWLIFDQFSFTSLMMTLSGAYTSNKINWATTVTDNLVQINTLINVDWDYHLRYSLDFSTPIRKLGLTINFDAEESWNRGMNSVNDVNNIYDSFSHRYALSADNRKKKKWDVASGLGATFTHTLYDIQESLNNKYFDLSWFAEIHYTPSESLHAELTADVTSYSDMSLGESIQVPLLRAAISYFFLPNKRGTLTLSAYDLLDKNQNIHRISELNYLRETRSNTLGRYVMLTFKYRLNKLARESGIKVDVSKRR